MLESAIEILETLAILLTGVVARLGLFVVVVAAFAVPVALAVGIWEGLRALTRWVRGFSQLDGMPFRYGAHHAPGHTWLLPAGRDAVRVGPDGLVPRLFEAIASVTLTAPGTRVDAGDTLAHIRQNGREARVLAPVSGRIREVNKRLQRRPDLLSLDPYGRGWLCALESKDGAYRLWPKDAWALEWLKAERHRIDRLTENELGMAAADGGELLQHDAAALSDASWRRIARALLGGA